MPERELAPDLIARLVEAGRSEDIGAALARLISPEEQLPAGEITRCCKNRWFALAESLSTDDLEALTRALTVAESSLHGWRAGSASPAIWTFTVFDQRFPERAGGLADWVLAHTDNDYVPSGSSNLGARSRDELVRRRRIGGASRRHQACRDRAGGRGSQASCCTGYSRSGERGQERRLEGRRRSSLERGRSTSVRAGWCKHARPRTSLGSRNSDRAHRGGGQHD